MSSLTAAPTLPVLFGPREQGRRRLSAHWYQTTRRDPLAIALFQRHYSCKRPKPSHARSGICGPGENLTLLSADADALFCWKWERYRMDAQTGAECTIFRNEGGARSSDLIREAVALARVRWPAVRLFTFVNRAKVRSTNPGYCFLCAGWQRCGTSATGLLVLEYPPSLCSITAQKSIVTRTRAGR